MSDILCWRERRYVGKHLTLSYERTRVILGVSDITRGLPGKYVDTFSFPDGWLQVRWKGIVLPYAVFDKDQRVTHAAIVENKRLGEVLSYIKEPQDKDLPKPRVKTNSEESGYKPKRHKTADFSAELERVRIATMARRASQGSDM